MGQSFKRGACQLVRQKHGVLADRPVQLTSSLRYDRLCEGRNPIAKYSARLRHWPPLPRTLAHDSPHGRLTRSRDLKIRTRASYRSY